MICPNKDFLSILDVSSLQISLTKQSPIPKNVGIARKALVGGRSALEYSKLGRAPVFPWTPGSWDMEPEEIISGRADPRNPQLLVRDPWHPP